MADGIHCTHVFSFYFYFFFFFFFSSFLFISLGSLISSFFWKWGNDVWISIRRCFFFFFLSMSLIALSSIETYQVCGVRLTQQIECWCKCANWCKYELCLKFSLSYGYTCGIYLNGSIKIEIHILCIHENQHFRKSFKKTNQAMNSSIMWNRNKRVNLR